MDGQRFDDLTRRLGRGVSRRTVMRGLVSGLAGALSGVGRGKASAVQQAPLGLDLDLDLLVCVGLTPLLATRVCLALNLPHVAESACEDGRCVIKTCDPGWADCDGQAANGCETPLGTAEHCGTCDDACASGICQDGNCLLTNGAPCAVGTECASGFCVDGVCCNKACAGDCQACGSDGVCGPAPDGGTCEGGICCDGACVDTATDVEHCGTCDTACPSAPNSRPVCTEGVCDTVCVGGAEPCGVECCGDTQICRFGACVACQPNDARCNTDADCCSGVCDGYWFECVPN